MTNLILGDCLEVLKGMDSDSIDACVTDPPAGIAFMGKDWDSFASGGRGNTADGKHPKGFANDVHWQYGNKARDQFIAFITEVMRECLRVMKPGAHGLVWALPRTSHWTGMALEDAGFEIRDSVHHLFGSGFPKSLDVSKAIDKMAGAEREVIGNKPGIHSMGKMKMHEGYHRPWMDEPDAAERAMQLTAPATPEAKAWEGWGTALKPAHEVWWLVRKPLVGTVAGNVLEYGTGALNIDGCRIGTEATDPNIRTNCVKHSRFKEAMFPIHATQPHGPASGRWPANVILSHSEDCECVGEKRVKSGNGGVPTKPTTVGIFGVEGSQCYQKYSDPDGMETVAAYDCAPDCPCKVLDEQSGVLTSGARRTGLEPQGPSLAHNTKGGYGFKATKPCEASTGGASRFYYVAKPSRRERNAGLGGMPEKFLATMGDGIGKREHNENEPQKRQNHHPTVKSINLMRYLTRLITPPNGIVLDPFMGSGSTGCACALEGFEFIGIEQDAEYLEIARRRIDYWAGTVQQEVMAL